MGESEIDIHTYLILVSLTADKWNCKRIVKVLQVKHEPLNFNNNQKQSLIRSDSAILNHCEPSLFGIISSMWNIDKSSDIDRKWFHCVSQPWPKHKKDDRPSLKLNRAATTSAKCPTTPPLRTQDRPRCDDLCLCRTSLVGPPQLQLPVRTLLSATVDHAAT